MSMFATPKIAAHSGELTKQDLVDTLAVFQVIDYDPDTTTKYGITATITCSVTVVDGPNAGRTEPEFFAAGNLARQIGEALDPMQMAPGRVIQGTSANGRSWYGIDWATDQGDLQRAEQALAPTPKPTLGEQARADRRDLRQQARQTPPDGDVPF